MLPFFPVIHEDELLYSVLARYAAARSVSRSRIGLALSDKTNAPINYHFPTALDHLVSILPSGHPITADDLIDNHTLFPYYAPFMNLLKAADSRQLMKRGFRAAISAKLGINASRVTKITHLRYCPHCLLDDTQKYQVPYWHRVHQIPNINICLEHRTILQNSPVSINQTRVSYITAEAVRSSASMDTATLNNSDDSLSHEFALASDAKWVLEAKMQAMGSDVLVPRYTDLLRARGFVTDRGMPRFKQIRKAINQFYSSMYLAKIGLSLNDENRMDWIYRLLSLAHREFSQPPVSHLVFIRFLGVDAKTFFSRKTDLPLFQDLDL